MAVIGRCFNIYKHTCKLLPMTVDLVCIEILSPNDGRRLRRASVEA